MRRRSSSARARRSDVQPDKVSIYPAWCKRCGNCVAFCPRDVLEVDEWGYQRAVRPERCISCRMCEMLCTDFAISVEEEEPAKGTERPVLAASSGEPGSSHSPKQSPERLAPEPVSEGDIDA